MPRLLTIPLLFLLVAFSGGQCPQDEHEETRERVHPTDGKQQVEKAGCGIAVRFGLHASDADGFDLGTIWSSASAPDATDAWLSTDQFARGVSEAFTENIGPYPGTLSITWEYDGAPLSATNGGTRPSFEVRGTSRRDLDSQLKREDREWRRAGRAFRFAPGPPASTATARGVARWVPDEGTPCEVEGRFTIRWIEIAAPERVREPSIPSPHPEGGELRHDGTLGRHTRTVGEQTHAFTVTPLRYAWSAVTTNCCDSTRYQVIQFARAARKSDAVSWMNRARAWALDITEDEKERARAGKRFDPTFTDRPGRSGETLLDNAGERTPSHWDAPGMTDVRYRQMLLTPGRHELHQQFFSFLVCHRGVLRDEADDILDKTDVVKAVIYNVTWIFDGPVNAPDRATVSARVVAMRDFECIPLGRVLAANRLLGGAFANPGPSELGESADFDADLQDLMSLDTIHAPAP